MHLVPCYNSQIGHVEFTASEGTDRLRGVRFSPLLRARGLSLAWGPEGDQDIIGLQEFETENLPGTCQRVAVS